MNQNCSHHFFVSQIFVGRTFIYLASLWFFLSFHLNSALFSGMRGGIFMCTLARLNKRLKHLLFHTLLKQEVQFFDDNNPGERSTTCLLRYLGTAWICRVNNAKGSPNENINADLTFGKWSVILNCNWPDKLASKKPHNLKQTLKLCRFKRLLNSVLFSVSPSRSSFLPLALWRGQDGPHGSAEC